MIVVVPLLPGFEGDMTSSSSAVMRLQVRLMQDTISRGKDSLIEQLINKGVDNWYDFIGFYGLRNHDVLNGRPIENLIYVHSKLMIVDDKYVIMGSANINDRSMRGKRDSEIACLTEDTSLIESKMGGESYKAAKFAHDLRSRLFMEHLGSDEPLEVQDPASEEFWAKWNERAKTNSEFYHEVF